MPAFPQEFFQARRIFQYDYIYFDAFFLLVWLFILFKNREYKPLLFGFVIAPVIYLIDAQIWWNSSAGPNYPSGTFIREYWMGGKPVLHPQGAFLFLKFGVDFMMTISYALFTFPWLIIMFRHLQQRTLLSTEVMKYTLLWVGMWFMVPLLSFLVGLDDTPVEAVRHMDTQFPYWILNLFIGYGLLFIIYRKTTALVLRIFILGIAGALIMELPLYLFGIRPTGILFVIFEGFFLLNQGIPYLFIAVDKVIPALQHRNRRR
jgi:hypothetical protein